MFKNRNRQMTGGCVSTLHSKNYKKRCLLLAIVAFQLVGQATALAQEPAPAAPAPATPAPAAPAPAAPAPAAPKPVTTPTVAAKPAALKAATSTSPEVVSETNKEVEVDIFDDPLKDELNEYWSAKGRTLEPVLDKLFSKAGRFSLALVLGMEPADPFWLYLTPGLRADYYFSEYSGIEFSMVYTQPISKQLQKNFEENKKRTGGGSLFDKSIFRTNVAYVWTPLYGKLGLLSKKLIHFDINFVAGLGINGVSRPSKNDNTKTSFAIAPEMFLGAGASFFFTQNWGLRVDGRSFFTLSNATKGNESFFKRISFPVEFTVGGTYTF